MAKHLVLLEIGKFSEYKYWKTGENVLRVSTVNIWQVYENIGIHK